MVVITLHLIPLVPAGTVLCANFVLGTIRISGGDIVLFTFSLERLGHASPLVRLNFVFMDFSQPHGCVEKIYGCAGSYVRYKYNCDIFLFVGKLVTLFRHYLINYCLLLFHLNVRQASFVL